MPADALAPPPNQDSKPYTRTVSGSWLGPLKVKVDHSVVLLQPKRDPKEKVPSLTLDLRTGRVAVVHGAPHMPDDSPTALGVIGLLQLEVGAVLALITKAKRVSTAGDALYHVTETQLVAHEAVKSTVSDLKLAALLQEALDAKEGATHLYFSHKADITLTPQRAADAASARAAAKASGAKGPPPPNPSIWSKADSRFVWNTALAKPLLDVGAGPFVTPVMVGYVGQVNGAVLRPSHGSAVDARVTVFGRVAWARAGTLAWRQGLDAEGAVAHELEVEVRVVLSPHQEAGTPDDEDLSLLDDFQREAASAAVTATTAAGNTHANGDSGGAGKVVGGEGEVVASWVCGRSSVPLLWAAPPDMRPSARIKLPGDRSLHVKPFASFSARMLRIYQSLALVHVAGHGRGQEALASTLADVAQSATSPTGSSTAGSSAAAGHKAGKQHEAGGVEAGAGSTGEVSKEGQGKGKGKAGEGGPLQLGAASGPARPTFSVWSVAPSGGLQLLGPGPGSSSSTGGVLEAVHKVLAAQGALDEVREGGARASSGSSAGSSAFQALSDNPSARRRAVAALTSLSAAGVHSYFLQVGPQVLSRQAGAMLLTGPTPLDVTHVLQAELGMSVLQQLLVARGLLSEGQALEELVGGAELDTAVRTLWAHCGDVLADQIARSGCTSHGPITTGLRASSQSVSNGVYVGGVRVQRWGVGTFNEALRQDGVDLLTGAHKVVPGVAVLMKKRNGYMTLQLAGVCLAWAVLQLVVALMWPGGLSELSYRGGIPLLAGILLGAVVWWQGEASVQQPQLCRDCVCPWEA